MCLASFRICEGSFEIKMLEIKDLSVEVDGKEVLKKINLKLEKGKVYALMGPNGSGKSSLANTLMGNPKYKILSGKILINGEDITNLPVHERAKKGLFLSYQNPVEISGVTVSNFLRTAFNSLNEKKISLLDFQKLLQEKAKELGIDEKFLTRYLNEGFSGGEKKKTEILQMLVLNPSIVVLDETDSGLDIDSLKTVSEGIKKFVDKNKIIMIITHYRRILDHINPDKVFVMVNGEIVLEGGKKIVDELEEKGYGFVK